MKHHRGTIIREGAVMALGDLAAKRQPIAVAQWLDDEDFDVRLEAAQTLLYDRVH
jgi:hypothetical protein